MSYLAWLVPIALGMGVVGLVAFLWSMRSGQYEDLDGAAARVLLADAANAPLLQAGSNGNDASELASRPPERAGGPSLSSYQRNARSRRHDRAR